MGGEDQILVVPHLDVRVVRADPKPFLGYSDNTNLLNWLWTHGVAGFYGGSTRCISGPGRAVDAVHARAARGAAHRRALQSPTPASPRTSARTGTTRPRCAEYGTASRPSRGPGPDRHDRDRPDLGRLHRGVVPVDPDRGPLPGDRGVLEGGVLLLESSEELIPAREFGWILRSLGERGLIDAVGAVLIARPPASELGHRPDAAGRAAYRAAQGDTAIGVVPRYNPDAVLWSASPSATPDPNGSSPTGPPHR